MPATGSGNLCNWLKISIGNLGAKYIWQSLEPHFFSKEVNTGYTAVINKLCKFWATKLNIWIKIKQIPNTITMLEHFLVIGFFFVFQCKETKYVQVLTTGGRKKYLKNSIAEYNEHKVYTMFNTLNHCQWICSVS